MLGTMLIRTTTEKRLFAVPLSIRPRTPRHRNRTGTGEITGRSYESIGGEHIHVIRNFSSFTHIW